MIWAVLGPSMYAYCTQLLICARAAQVPAFVKLQEINLN